jgi:hypothetical protein
MPERRHLLPFLTRLPLTERLERLAGAAHALRRRGLVAVALGLASAACGSAGDPPSALPSAGGAGGTGGGTGTCNVDTLESPPASAVHLTQCTPVDYSTNPPSGGDHYGVWAAFQTYAYPLPLGYVVHALEHGAIAFWYNCPEGCAEEVAEVQAFIDSRPEDPLCDGRAAVRRALLMPNPALESRWAASAWGYALTADCFDAAEFGAFYTAHYAQAPEQLCNDGQVISANACP